jgi:ComF family protein
MIDIVRHIRRGVSQIIFPAVCVCCGRENTQKQRQLCSFCLEERFEDANPENDLASSDTLLPDGIYGQHALWQFDKGGDLQHLLHQLKYERLTTIGVDLGRKLAERTETHATIKKVIEERNTILLPVPLHYLKFRYRGFNQAFEIAKGFQEVWQIPICDIRSVIRTKNTRSQTGFSLDKRRKNMEGAFKVKDQSAIKNKLVLIIDDVFTTGSTTFELGRTILEAGSGPIIILTVAQA